jgi:hypothetical protein
MVKFRILALTLFVTLVVVFNTYPVIGGLIETAGNTVIGASEVAVDTVKGVGKSFAEPKVLPGKPERLQKLEKKHEICEDESTCPEKITLTEHQEAPAQAIKNGQKLQTTHEACHDEATCPE